MDRTEERIGELGLAGEVWDWPHVFHYAGGSEDGPFWVRGEEPKEQWGTPKLSEKASAFDIADVARVEASVPGDNDGPDWVAFGLLADGRWFSISAGCDYTGWG